MRGRDVGIGPNQFVIGLAYLVGNQKKETPMRHEKPEAPPTHSLKAATTTALREERRPAVRKVV